MIAGPKRKPTPPAPVEPTRPAELDAAAPRLTAPTAIPGVTRRRTEATPPALKRLAPAASADVITRAARLLGNVPLEGGTDRLAVLWGHQLQQDYSDLVSATLELSGDVALVKAAGYVNRMVAVLSSIDLQAVFAAQASSAGIGNYLKKLNSRVDTPDELEAARLELDQLVRLMGNSLEPLLALKERLHLQSRRIDDAGVDVEAAALAAQFLSDQFAEKRPELSGRFVERAMSLTQTLAQIRGSAGLRGAQTDQPLHLIGAIQNVALVSVPAWLVTVAALNTALRSNKRPTQTEAGELDYRLRTILQQLKA